MTDTDNRRWLYDQAKKKGVDVGEYEAFDKAMDDANNRKWVYDQATKKGLDLGDYDAYDKAIGPAVAPEIAPAPKPAERVNVAPDTAVAETTAVSKPQIADPVRETYNPIAGEQRPVSDFQAFVDDFTRLHSVNQELEGSKSRSRAKLSAGAYELDEEFAGPTLPRTKEFAEQFKEGTKQAKEQTARLEKEKKQLVARLDMNPEYRKYINEQADMVSEVKQDVLQRMEERGSSAGNFVPYTQDYMGAGAVTPSVDREAMMDSAALALYDDAEKMLRSPLKHGEESGWANYWKGTEDRLSDPDFWTLGLSELTDLSLVRNVLEKVQKHVDEIGESRLDSVIEDEGEDLSFLTPGEKELFLAYFTNLEAKRMRSDDMSSGYKAGQTATDSMKFMAEMGYSGAVGKAATKGMTKYLTKKLASRLVGMNSKSLGYKLAKNGLGWGIKKAGNVVSTVAGVPLTPELPLGVMRRATELDEQGRLPKIDANLVANGSLDAMLEYFTEQGSIVADGLKVLGKVVPVQQFAKSFLGADAAAFLKGMSKSQVANLMKQGAWNGFVDEGLEELDNAIYDYVRGNKDALTDFFSTDNLLELSASFAGMSMMGAAGSAAQMAKVNYDYSNAEKDLREMMAKRGYSDEQIQHIIDVANNSSISDLTASLSNVLTDGYSSRALAGATDEMRFRLRKTDDFKVVKDFIDATARRTAMNGIHQGQQDERIEDEKMRMVQELGNHRFWQQRKQGDLTVDNVVIARVKGNEGLGLEDGQFVFLTSTPDANTGEIAFLTEDGRTGFITSDDIMPVQANGVASLAVEKPLREYLSYQVMRRQADAEQEDLDEQRDEQVQQLAQQYQVEDEIEIDGNKGIISNVTNDGIEVSFADENGAESVRFYPWEDVAQRQGTPMSVTTEEEKIAASLGEQQAQKDREDAVAQIIRDRKDDLTFVDNGVTFTVRDENPIKAGSVNADGTVTVNFVGSDGSSRSLVLDTKNRPTAQAPAEQPQESGYQIPRDKNGDIDYDKLMEENPAEFARVNDEESQDGGASTQTLFKNRIAELQKELKQNQENLAKQSKPSEMKKYQRKVADIQGKIANLQSVLDSYNVASAEVDTPAAPAPVAPSPAPAPKPAARVPKRKAKRYQALLDQLGDPLDFEDMVMRLIAGDSIRFKWKSNGNRRGLEDLFGGQMAEQRRRINILSNDGGLYLDAAVEELLQAYAEERGVDVDQLEIDAMDAVGIVEDVIRGYSVKDMVDTIQRRHEEAKYNPMEDEDYVQGMLEYEAEKYGLTVKGYEKLAAMAAELGVGTDELFDLMLYNDSFIEKYDADVPLSDEEQAEFDNILAEQNFDREEYGREQETADSDGTDVGAGEDTGSEAPEGTDAGEQVAETPETGPVVSEGEQPGDTGAGLPAAVGEREGEGAWSETGSSEVPAGNVPGAGTETAETVEEAPAAEEEAAEPQAETAEETAEEQTPAEETTVEETPVEQAVEEAAAEAEQAEETLLTEQQILNANIEEELKAMAIAYINGDRSFANTIAYQNALIEIQNNAGDSTQTGATDSSDAGSAQVDGGTDETSADGSGQRGASSGDVAGGTGETDVPGNEPRRPVRGRKNSPSHGVPSAGERSDSGVAGEEPGLFDEPADGGRPDVGGTSGSAGRDVRSAGAGENGGTGAGETEQRGTEAGSADIDAEIASLKGELSDLWKDFTKAGQANLSLSIVGMNGQQIQILGKILATSARLGYQFLKKGIRTLQNFREKLREIIGDPLKKVVGYSDAEIDEFINEIWDASYTMNGETHKISEWADIIGQEELRKEMKRTLDEKRELQEKAEPIKVKIADEDNIRETLPFLLPAQREDVRRAEVQFFDESHNDRDHAFGKGYMFTNGTGTGKTYTGLGIAKRFIKQGKGRILILTPSQEKVGDWIRDAENLKIKLSRLDDTKDKGTGAVITTFANFRQNRALYEDVFDLVIYDESHRIMENQEGEESIGTKAHYMISNRNEEAALERLQACHPLWIEEEQLTDAKKEIENKLASADDYNEIVKLEDELGKIENRLAVIREKQEKLLPEMRAKAAESVPKTKVVFLSATPFNTVQNLEYAEGYIFSYPEENEATKGTSRHKSPKEEFMDKWFGSMISYKGGKQVTSIENEDAVTKQEVAFSDYLQNTLQTMNGRIIDSEYDYSRDFPTVQVELANEFNSAMEDLRRHPVMRVMDDPNVGAFGHLSDYNWSSFLFEAMKVSAILPRIREHLAMGRKVVIFHRRINAPGQREESDNSTRRRKAYPPVQPPFALGLQQALDFAAGTRDAGLAARIMTAVRMFKEKYAALLAWEQTLDYRSAREQLIDAFATDEDRKAYEKAHQEWEKKAAEAIKNGKKVPAEPELKASEVGLFSGQESKGAKHKDIEAFNSDEGKNIIVVQEASGKEGISLHDQTGKGHQRVMISLALPQSPITFIQQEGRIYRIGNRSNAIFEYPLLGINLELWLFSQKFNSRAGTTENLALGSLGRGLKRSIAQGVLEHQGVIPLEGQGIGGKEWDARQSTDGGATGYDGAIADYYTNVKQKPGREDREGVDYFPTPEPVGFKMVEWGKIADGESVLEPSAGHGAIARYVPTSNELTAIEPSQSLNSRLSILVGGGNRTIKDIEFEDYNIVNKHDVVVMNPPYGVGGATAMAHVEKAFDHLNEGGRLIAIIPDGPAMEKKLDKWMGEHPEAVMTGEVKLPSVAFSRAGTSVRTRIVVFDKVTRAETRKTVPQKQTYDFSDIEEIKDLFERMRNVNMPERTVDKVAIKMRTAKRLMPEFKKIEDVVQKKSDFNEVNEQGIRLDIPYARYNRMYIPMNGRFKWDDKNKRHAVLEINFSEMEPLNRDVAQKYKTVLGLLELEDSVFARRATNRAYRIEDSEIEPLRQFYKVFMKAIRDLSGLTEAQILRVADGLSIDISPAEIEGTDLTMDSLREKFDVANGGNEERKELFDKVFAVAKKLGLKINVYHNNGNDVANYNIGDNSLNINSTKWNKVDNEARAQTILHEMIHAVTSYSLYLYEAMESGGFISAEQERMANEVMTPEIMDACKDLVRVYNLIKSGEESRHFAGEYGLKNVHEMVAELANTRFREKLKARNLWRRIVNGIKRILGYPADDAEATTAEKEVVAALDTLLENFNPESYEKARAVVNRGNFNVVNNLEIPEPSPEEQRQANVAYAKGVLNGTIGIAPNGKKSNLTNEQWAIARTNAFKEWFGDWQDNPTTDMPLDENGEPTAESVDRFVNGNNPDGPGNDGLRFRNSTDNTNFVENEEYDGERTADEATDNRGDVRGLSESEARKLAVRTDYGRVRMLEPEVAPTRREYRDDSEGAFARRTDREQEAQRLIAAAKEHGLFIEPGTIGSPDHRIPGQSKESIVYIDEANNRVIKVKDPFAAESMTNNSPFDEIYQHLIHNILFPESRYEFLGITTNYRGDEVRIVLAQPYIASKDRVWDAQADKFIKDHGFRRVDGYKAENDDVVVMDFYGANILKDAEGNLHLIDPLISFKMNPKDIIEDYLADDSDTRYRIREDEPPTKTGIGYKVFYLKNGNLYPPMVANPNGAATPVGVWLDADAAPVAETSKTGRAKVKAGGRGTQGGSGMLAYRPGWHLGEIPYALQFNRVNPETGERELFPKDFVWAEVEYADDVDYQDEAMSYGMTPSGKFQHSLAGLPRVPENGSYKYRTNPNPETDPWIITGAMKVKRILTQGEVDDMVREAGREPQKKQPGGVSDEQIAKLNEKIAQASDASVASIEDAAMDTAKKLGVPIRLLDAEQAKKESKGNEKKRRSKGWFDPKTNEVVVVVPNAENAADAEATVLHEVVGHYGLRQLFGGRFEQTIDTLRAMASEEIRKKVSDLAQKLGVDENVAMEEFLAELAESGATNNDELSFWEQAKQFIRNLLRSLGINIGALTEADMNYLIWASRRNLEKTGSDLLRAADRAVVRSAMKAMAQDSHNEQRETPDVLLRSAATPEYAKAAVARQYEKRIADSSYQFREAMQDSMLSLRDFMLSVAKAEGKNIKYVEDIEGFENAYLAENALSSRTKIEQDVFGKLLMEPFVKEVAALAKTDEEKEQLTNYMMAKHGLERNEKFAERDAINIYRNLYDATVKSVKSDRSLTPEDKADAIAAAEAEFEKHKAEVLAHSDEKYLEFREKDYSGLTALTEKDNVAEAEEEAEKMVEDYENSHDVDALWEAKNKVTDAILTKMQETGMLTKDVMKDIKDMFQYYIPLRGFEETTSDEEYAYLDDSHGPLNSPILRAEGRKSKADDPISTLANMADVAIMQGNRNDMKQKFLNFVLNHPSDLVSVNDLWIQFNDVTGEWEAVFAPLDEHDSPEQIAQKVEAFEEQMKTLAAQEPDKYKKAKDAKNIPYRVINGHLKEHQILVKRLGKTYVLTVNGNPRLAQAINGETNPDATQKGVLGAVGRIAKTTTTTLSQFYTTRNPEFIASNFCRDMLYANTMVEVKENGKYAMAFHKNFVRVNPGRMVGLLRKFESQSLDMNDPLEKAFQEFMMNGGETGYTTIKDIEKQKKEIAKQIKKMQGQNAAEVAWEALGDTMDLLNRAVENCCRFAAFITSREQGRSLERSIYDAKEITVNFNKKGAGDKFFRQTGQSWWGNTGSFISGAGREFYAFWNAGLQGTTNFLRAAKRNPVKFGFGAAATFVLGGLMPVIAEYLYGGDDDDDKNSYYNLPEYTRRSNICFRAGERWITIPLPIELRGIYGLGELAMGQMLGKENYDAQELTYNTLSQVSQMMPLDMLEGGGGLHALIPTGIKPAAEAYTNRKWTGLPMYQQKNQWNEDMPEWTRAFKSANRQLIELTAAINGATAEYGDKYEKGFINLNPARIEYMLNGYFGGYATTAQTLVKMAEMATGDRDFDWNNVLIARRFVKAGDETTEYRKLNNEYYDLRDEYEHTKKQHKRYEDNDDTERLNRLENSDKYMRYEIFDAYFPQIDKLNRDANHAEDEDEAEQLNKDKFDIIRDMVREIHETERKRKSKD